MSLYRYRDICPVCDGITGRGPEKARCKCPEPERDEQAEPLVEVEVLEPRDGRDRRAA